MLYFLKLLPPHLIPYFQCRICFFPYVLQQPACAAGVKRCNKASKVMRQRTVKAIQSYFQPGKLHVFSG
jgi:hypothetical protein